MQATLVMFKADGSRRDFPLQNGCMVVGRKNSCELRIPLSSVSRQHCEISVDGDTVRLKDLGSSNGTYHNSIRVQEAELEPGDEIVVGPVVFTVVIDGIPANIEPVHSIVGHDDSHDSAMTSAGDLSHGLTPDDITSSLEDDDDASGSASALKLDAAPQSAAATDPDDSDDRIFDLDLAEAGGSGKKKPGNSSGSTGPGGSTESSILDFDFDDLTDDD